MALHSTIQKTERRLRLMTTDIQLPHLRSEWNKAKKAKSVAVLHTVSYMRVVNRLSRFKWLLVDRIVAVRLQKARP